MDFIELQNISKKYKNDRILHKVSYRFEQNNSYAVTGPNGSGKSTLLKICASYLEPTTGKVIFHLNGGDVAPAEAYRHISLATPYMELPEEFTPLEILDFHLNFKAFYGGITKKQFLEKVFLTEAARKPVSKFSSGMKQRFKIGLAILTVSRVLLLDEPLINLDQKGIDLYQSLIRDYAANRIVLVCSNNVQDEIAFCGHHLNIMDYKS